MDNGFELEQHDYFVKGTKIHKEWEDLHKKIDVEQARQNYDYIRSLLPDDEYNDAYDNIAKFEMNRLEKCYKHNKLDYFFPVHSEVKVEEDYGDIRLVGIVDSIFRNFDDEYIIFELKTGKFFSSTPTSMRRELTFYKTLVEQTDLLDRKVKYLGYYFSHVDRSNQEIFKKRSKTALDKKMNEIKQAYDTGLFAKKESQLCVNCDFKRICFKV